MSDIGSKKPKVLGARVAGLRLTPEERFVMARIDGKLSVDDLVALTGLEEHRLEQIVSKLALDGAVDLGAEPRFAPPPVEDGETSMADFAAALGMDPKKFGPGGGPAAAGGGAPPPANAPKPATPAARRPIIRPKKPEAPVVGAKPEPDKPETYEEGPQEQKAAAATDEKAVAGADAAADADADAPLIMATPLGPDDDLPEVELALNAAAFDAFLDDAAEGEEAAAATSSQRMKAAEEQQLELEEVTDDEGAEGEEEGEGEEAQSEETPTGPSAKDLKEDEISRAVAERNYRQVYERHWHPLTPDARIAGAKTAHGPDLLALCFDPDPRVIASVLENHTTGLDHVRLIAFYHRTGTGLEILARRQEWLRDILVERRLLRNPMIGDIVLGRVMSPKRLFQTYKIAIDREIPELTRSKVRGLIRSKWQNATSEERADLLFRTEARCLIIMTGCTFDAKTTAILCGRPINSVMFVQSIAKFPASPPALLAHLMKQPFVRKNMPLKKLLLAHPNMPGDVKRNI